MSNERKTLPEGDLTVLSLATLVAEELGVSQGDGLKAVQAVLGAIGRTVADGHRVRINNFGSFEPGTHRVRSGTLRTPQGNEMELNPRAIKVVKFTVRGRLRDVLNDGGEYSGIARVVSPRGPRADRPVTDLEAAFAAGGADDEELSA